MKLKPGRPGKKVERGLKRKTSEQKKHRPDRKVDDDDASIERAMEQHAKDVARALNENFED